MRPCRKILAKNVCKSSSVLLNADTLAGGLAMLLYENRGQEPAVDRRQTPTTLHVIRATVSQTAAAHTSALDELKRALSSESTKLADEQVALEAEHALALYALEAEHASALYAIEQAYSAAKVRLAADQEALNTERGTILVDDLEALDTERNTTAQRSYEVSKSNEVSEEQLAVTTGGEVLQAVAAASELATTSILISRASRDFLKANRTLPCEVLAVPGLAQASAELGYVTEIESLSNAVGDALGYDTENNDLTNEATSSSSKIMVNEFFFSSSSKALGYDTENSDLTNEAASPPSKITTCDDTKTVLAPNTDFCCADYYERGCSAPDFVPGSPLEEPFLVSNSASSSSSSSPSSSSKTLLMAAVNGNEQAAAWAVFKIRAVERNRHDR